MFFFIYKFVDIYYIYSQLYALLTKLYNKRNDILSSNAH